MVLGFVDQIGAGAFQCLQGANKMPVAVERYLDGSPNQLLLGQIRFGGYFPKRTR